MSKPPPSCATPTPRQGTGAGNGRHGVHYPPGFWRGPEPVHEMTVCMLHARRLVKAALFPFSSPCHQKEPKWTTFTPPAAGQSRHYRGRLLLRGLQAEGMGLGSDLLCNFGCR